MDHFFTGRQAVGAARQGVFATGAVTAAAQTMEEQQIWTAPWNIGEWTNPFEAAQKQWVPDKPWQQQVGAVGAFGQAMWGNVEHKPMIGPAVQVSERTGASAFIALEAVGDLITMPLGGRFDERTGITTGGLSVLEVARGVTQVAIEPIFRNVTLRRWHDTFPANQPFTRPGVYVRLGV